MVDDRYAGYLWMLQVKQIKTTMLNILLTKHKLVAYLFGDLGNCRVVGKQHVGYNVQSWNCWHLSQRWSTCVYNHSVVLTSMVAICVQSRA